MKRKKSVLSRGGRGGKRRGLYKKNNITKSKLIVEEKHRPKDDHGPHPGDPKISKEHEAFARRMG